jgi:deoxyxylulose-5-phosphate synthase
MGLDYHYVQDGHDFEHLISVFNKVKHTEHPVVVHIHTIKGKGFEFAEKNREQWHWGMSQQEHPVAIRVPAMGVIESGVEDKTDYSKLNKYQVTKAFN